MNIRSNPSDAFIEPPNGTTINGRIENVVLTAPEVDEDTSYRIIINATKPDYVGTNASASIYVLDVKPPPLCSDCEPQVPIFLFLLFMAIFVAVAAILVSLRRPDDRS
jgi:hypothetical protein